MIIILVTMKKIGYNKSDWKSALPNLFNILSKKDIEKIDSKLLELQERKKKEIKNNTVAKNSQKQVASITNNVSNQNTLNSEIKTLSSFRSYVENSASIKNKQQIIKLIEDIENAKDNNDTNFLRKFLELLELLPDILPIPPF